MGLETTLFNIFAGNKAAEEAKKAERDIIRRTDTEQARQEAVNQPFLSAGTTGINKLADFVTGGADYLGETGNALLDQALGDVTGRFAAMGLNDSGAHRNALLSEAVRQRLGIGNQMFQRANVLANYGPGAVGRFNQAGQFATNMFANARRGEGEAGAFPWLNASNSLYRWENQILDAAGNAAGGGFR